MSRPRKQFDERIQPVERQRVHEQISQQINQMISEGILKPGDQLPSERDLAERFKVSRNSVRDALRTLEARGLLEIRQGGGTYVQAAHGAELYRAMTDLFAQKKLMTEAVLHLRQIIEPGVAYAAAQAASDADLKKLDGILERHEERAAHGDTGVEEDALFHHSIAQMAGNPLLLWILDLINDSFKDTRDTLLKYHGTATRHGHRRILAALQAHDPVAARQAMMDHLQEVMETYQVEEEKPHSAG